mgnify:CR=1 FL=1
MAGVGAFAALVGRRYGFGTPADMGPGFFPQLLGWLLAALGAAIALRAWLHGSEGGSALRWRSMACVSGAILLFALALEPAGVVPAAFGAALVASIADERVGWPGRIATAAGVAALAVLVFVGALGMALPLGPAGR